MIAEISGFENKCVGCGACANICPADAIRMERNREGFLFPSVDSAKCMQCDRCVGVCQIYREKKCSGFEQKVYACQAKDKELLIEATAGGFFPVLASCVIENGGIVYGCAWDEEMNATHCGGTDRDMIRKFNGSKYVQSDTTKIYPEIYDYLSEGKTVLFSGTPCQVDALNNYCEDIDTSNLLTVDVVCYGVPSPLLFSAYIENLNKEYGARVIDFKFRDKHTYGWSHTTVVTFVKSDGTTFVIEEPDHNKIDYYKMFGIRNCYRKSCYHCKYNEINRVSDFTTGNYWGIEKKSDVFEASLGVSMAIINTPKALLTFQKIADRMTIEERSISDAIESNDALVIGSALPKQRDAIYHNFSKKGFDSTFQKYYTNGSTNSVKLRIKKIIKSILRR